MSFVEGYCNVGGEFEKGVLRKVDFRCDGMLGEAVIEDFLRVLPIVLMSEMGR